MIRGSCLCGIVSFEFEEIEGPFRLCHCHRCQKVSGSAYFSGFVAKGLVFLGGESHIRSYEAPILEFPPAYRRAFCENCGSQMPWQVFKQDRYAVPAGSLDEDPGIRPSEHVFVECNAPWHEITDELPQFTEPRLMYNWAREGELTGENVVERYEFLRDAFPDSEISREVQERLAQLKGPDTQ